jgi:phosphoribosylformylglycinamidine cyclo-ligase
MKESITYADAGVDINAGDELVERIKPFAQMTFTPEIIGGLGGFAGLCRVPKMKEPVLVSGADGVGTKVKIAFELNKHDSIGEDLVAMCVNDIITCGARPLFFLDYFATSKLNVDVATKVIRGIAVGCKIAKCALLGGETAEMPGMYSNGEYDLAGFAVGIVNKPNIIDGSRVVEGDVVIGLPSTGLHSNGYSLARKVVENFEFDDNSAYSRSWVMDRLIIPTKIYAREVRKVLKHGVNVKAMSHITGGGIPGNLPRVLPVGFGVVLERAWARAPIYYFLQTAGHIDICEMRRTFNCGVGFIFIVGKKDNLKVIEILDGIGAEPMYLGKVVAIPKETMFEDRVIYSFSD